MIRTEAPGKVILLGEYAVLYGATALVAAINRCAHVTVEPSDRFTLEAMGLTVTADDTESLVRQERRFGLVAAVLAEVGYDLPRARITIDTDAFYAGENKLGLGSSAAVAVALADALRRHRGENPNSETLFRDAHRAHRRAQGGVGSGVDIAASAFGGVLAYRAPAGDESAPQRAQALAWPETLRWSVVYTGISAATPALVASVEALRERSPARASRVLGALAEAAEAGARAFADGDAALFLAEVDRFHRALEAVESAADVAIVSDVHRERRAVARRSGAVYKPSGAGGGDIGVAFWDADGGAPFSDALPLELYPATERYA